MPQQWLIEKVNEAGGWISMEKFMGLCLHDPQNGYYGSRIKELGGKGDFSTSATLSPTLAKALVKRYRKAVGNHGERLPVIEIGAGDGSLAASFRKELGWRERLRTEYFIIDSSLPLQKLQKKKLGAFATHYDTVGKALAACGGKAFLFSNELVDAFPARILQRSEAGWEEVGLHVYAKRLMEKNRILAPHELPESSALEYYTTPGQRVEILENYRNWCREWHTHWKEGEMITIDYGSTVDDLYYRRPWGTIRGFSAHKRVTGWDLYSHPGRIDLTCDVNFTDLMEWGRENGWQTDGILYQRDFLLPCSSGSDADTFLNDPQGAGTAFRVLIQSPVPGMTTNFL